MAKIEHCASANDELSESDYDDDAVVQLYG